MQLSRMLNIFPGVVVSRPLPLRGAGEGDSRLDARQENSRGPLPPCVAGEEDSKSTTVDAGLNAHQTPLRMNLIHLPGKPAGVFFGSSWHLAGNLIHLPDEPAGVFPPLSRNKA